MSIRKVEHGETWYCDGAYLWWDDKKGYFRLESIEGEMYRDESALFWAFDENDKEYCFEEYIKPLKEPTCPECQGDGSIDCNNKNEWYVLCKCHDTPYFKNPFKAWENWENYCKGEIK